MKEFHASAATTPKAAVASEMMVVRNASFIETLQSERRIGGRADEQLSCQVEGSDRQLAAMI